MVDQMELRRVGARLRQKVVSVTKLERYLGPRPTNGVVVDIGFTPRPRLPMRQHRLQREAQYEFEDIRIDDLLYMLGKTTLKCR